MEVETEQTITSQKKQTITITNNYNNKPTITITNNLAIWWAGSLSTVKVETEQSLVSVAEVALSSTITKTDRKQHQQKQIRIRITSEKSMLLLQMWCCLKR